VGTETIKQYDTRPNSENEKAGNAKKYRKSFQFEQQWVNMHG